MGNQDCSRCFSFRGANRQEYSPQMVISWDEEQLYTTRTKLLRKRYQEKSNSLIMISFITSVHTVIKRDDNSRNYQRSPINHAEYNDTADPKKKHFIATEGSYGWWHSRSGVVAFQCIQQLLLNSLRFHDRFWKTFFTAPFWSLLGRHVVWCNGFDGCQKEKEWEEEDMLTDWHCDGPAKSNNLKDFSMGYR